MTNFNFKVGDKVYFPTGTNEVLEVSSDLIISYLATDCVNHNVSIKKDNKFYNFHHNPSFFPATQEWYEKLVHVYPDLEKPPVKKDSKEIIQKMLDDGWLGVSCYTSDYDKNPHRHNKIDVILEIREGTDYIFKTDTVSWKYARPFELKSGKDIIDYVDGKMILEEITNDTTN